MKLRTCIVKEKNKGYFHGWFQRSEIAAPSPFAGGHSGGQLQDVVGLVELEDGNMIEVIPFDLRFTDMNIGTNEKFKVNNSLPINLTGGDFSNSLRKSIVDNLQKEIESQLNGDLTITGTIKY